MKRFFDTGIWDKEWFLELSDAERSAWFFILSKCDNVGVWAPNTSIFERLTGASVDWESFRERLNGNIEVLDNGKWWVVDFCTFQHPDLSEDSKSKPVQSYISLLKKHGLWERYIGHVYPTDTLSIGYRDRDRDREQVREEEEAAPKAEVVEVIDHFNSVTASRVKPSSQAVAKYVSGRLSDGYTVDDLKAVINEKSSQWLGTDMEKWLRVPTLFGPEKFPGYLAEVDRQKAPAVTETTFKPSRFTSGT